MEDTRDPVQRPLWRVFALVLGQFAFRPHGSVNFADRLFHQVVRVLALMVIALAVLLVVELFRGSWESIRHFGVGFIYGTTWDPVKEKFGALPPMVGTLVQSLLGLLIAVPISLGAAIFIAMYVPRWLRGPISYLVESLAAIPSVIFGLWGLFIMVPVVRVVQIWLKAHLGWFPLFSGPAMFGIGVLAAGLMLAIMITPIIASISRDIIRSVPRSQMEGMMALGATRWEAIWRAVLPYARGGLIGAVMLGLGRALGETMAVTMVGGNAFKLLHSLFDPAHSMASIIASEFSEATYGLYVSSLIYMGLVLFGITIVVNVLAQLLIWRTTKGRAGTVA
jgi:phosphate transport system permease protein